MKMRTTIAALAVACAAYSSALVVNHGFEISEPTGGGHPSTYGDWGGDTTTILGVSQGIAPMVGSQMIRFDETTASGASAGGRDSDLIQLIDLSSYSSAIASGNLSVNGSIWVNRIAGSTDDQFLLRLRSYTGTASGFHANVNSYGAEALVSINSDADASTWQQISTTLLLPSNTTYLALWASARENVVNNATSPEFEGHFGDGASLQVVPEPASLAVLGLGALALIRRRKSK